MVNKYEEICQTLNNNGVRLFIDKRYNKNAVYIRLEIGPKDMKGDTAMARRDERDNKGRLENVSLKWKNIEKDIFKLWDDIYDTL